ncbi:hypothetical protein EPR50_G00033730 [Perca flavescens]|uniref:Vesicle transport protein GOT1A n=2 Tax=Perca flavescens TaxID=8167 RepID=A0A484DDI6_PERFV|nr:hypothetical protein EPR50_G00033730 [Perca flavescens]
MFNSHADNINAQRSLLRKGEDSFVPDSHGETKPLSRRGEETPVITMVAVTEFQKIGIGLMGFGGFFLLFGVLLYFDSVLLGFGNILFLTGLTFIIGFKRTAHFFFKRQKFRGSLFFLGGVSLVLCRWPIIGMLVESYGFVLLFRSFFPMALGFLLSAVNIPFLSAFFPSSSSMV